MRTAVASVVVAASAALARAADPADAAQRARGVVGRVFAEPEFSPLSEADKIPRLVPDAAATWIQELARQIADALSGTFKWMAHALFALLKWLFGGIGRLFGGGGAGEGSGEIARLVGWALGIVAVGLVAWLLVRLLRASADERRARASVILAPSPTDAQDDALSRSPDEWRRAATELAQDGRRRESIRALYLSLLAALHHAGAIDYDRTRTNTAYVGDLRADHAARPRFRSLTERFDVCWYGRREPSQDDVDAATSEAQAVLHAFEAETAHV